MTDYMYNKKMAEHMDKINRIMERMIDDTNDYAISHREKTIADFPYVEKHVVNQLKLNGEWIYNRLNCHTNVNFVIKQTS